MQSGEFTFKAAPFKVLITNDSDGHPAWKWAEHTVDQLVSIDATVTDPEKARLAVAFRNWIVETLILLYGQSSRPSTNRCIELIKQASQKTPWEESIQQLEPQIQHIIETNLNTIYRNQ